MIQQVAVMFISLGGGGHSRIAQLREIAEKLLLICGQRCDESVRISYSHACVYLHIILVLVVFIP